MTLIGELAVNVVARTDKLSKGLKTARREVSGVAKSFKSATAGITSFTSAAFGIGGGLGLLGVANSISKNAEAIDKLAKTSQKLGITTEGLAGLQVAAERTGVSFENLETGLQRMTRQLAEANQGSETAAKGFDALGLNVEDLIKLAPDEVFSRVAEEIEGVQNQTEKLKVAYDLFGRSGVDLVRTLALGRRGLREMRDEAERLGLAVSGEEAARVEEFNDQLDRMKALLGSTGRTLTIKLAPGLTQFMEGLEALVAPKPTAGAPGTQPGRRSFLGNRWENVKDLYGLSPGVILSQRLIGDPLFQARASQGLPAMQPHERKSQDELQRIRGLSEQQLAEQRRTREAAEAARAAEDRAEVDQVFNVTIP